MKTLIEERAVICAEYIVKNKCTVRQAAKKFGVSKSTIHKDVSERLKYIDKELFSDVKKILEKNKSERHIRGGLATRSHWMEVKEHNS